MCKIPNFHYYFAVGGYMPLWTKWKGQVQSQYEYSCSCHILGKGFSGPGQWLAYNQGIESAVGAIEPSVYERQGNGARFPIRADTAYAKDLMSIKRGHGVGDWMATSACSSSAFTGRTSVVIPLRIHTFARCYNKAQHCLLKWIEPLGKTLHAREGSNYLSFPLPTV